MRSCIAIAVVIMVALGGHPAKAEDGASQQPTRIEINQEAKAFIFIIDNRPVAILDKDGLTVREGINYGATLMDADRPHFDRKIDSLKTEAADD